MKIAMILITIVMCNAIGYDIEQIVACNAIGCDTDRGVQCYGYDTDCLCVG